jgi:hypothetical protein
MFLVFSTQPIHFIAIKDCKVCAGIRDEINFKES